MVLFVARCLLFVACCLLCALLVVVVCVLDARCSLLFFRCLCFAVCSLLLEEADAAVVGVLLQKVETARFNAVCFDTHGYRRT